MKNKTTRILGIMLILLSWFFWGIIIILPLFKLTLKQYAIVYPVLLIATNIFWVGATLVGKELLLKYQILPKLKTAIKYLRKKVLG